MRAASVHPASSDRGQLPLELGFLASRLYPEKLLQLVAHQAEQAGVAPERQLIAEGHCSEDFYHRALSEYLGLAFIEMPVLKSDVPICDLGRCSVGRAADQQPFDYVIAPRGPEIGALLAMRPLSPAFARVAMTSPRRFAQALRSAHGDGLATVASEEVPAGNAAWSARNRPLRSQCIVALVLEGGVFFLWGINPTITGFMLSLLIALVFLLQISFRLMAIWEGAKAPLGPAPRKLADRELPVYTVLVPLYREARVAKGLIEALARLDYPPAKLDVKILVESSDKETMAALRQTFLPPCFEVVVCPAGLPRTKPRALNIGLRFARGAFVVVYDAEDRPEPDQLRLAAGVFASSDAKVACLQARLAIDNSRECWLTRYFALEYAQLFDAMLPGMARLGLPIPLGGTSNHFRKDALVEVGGWDAWNVTEDADLGMRLARTGRTVDVLSSTTWEEAPIRFRAWFRQRTRWLKGWIQTSLVHGALTPRLVSEIGLFGALAVFTLTYGLVGTALGLPFFLINVARSLLDGSLFGPDDLLQFASSVNAFLIFLLGTAALLWPLSIGAARRGLRLMLQDAALLPLYYLMASVACWWALWELFDAPSFWAKTEHGLGHRRAAPEHSVLKRASGDPSPTPRAGARG